ncbi:MAG TPA: hypothetical protein VIM12_01835 [Noviherbaspirillum sp.]|jgi:hypothetical protein|uniref:hypothetical protein n=1 Tax=Noviherbaspirillum sp. TaxID=1926288 RepID=UPI002F933C85
MKTLLLMLLIAICGIAWRSPEIVALLDPAAAGGAKAASPGLAAPSVQDMATPRPEGQRPMTAQEFAELARTDPQAYRKYLDSMRVREERSEVDKLMHFFARGKYE